MALKDAVSKLEAVGNAVIEDVSSLKNVISNPENSEAEQAIITVASKLQELSSEIKNALPVSQPTVEQPAVSNMAEPVNPNPEPEHVPS